MAFKINKKCIVCSKVKRISPNRVTCGRVCAKRFRLQRHKFVNDKPKNKKSNKPKQKNT